MYKLASGEVLVVREGEEEFPLYPSEDVLLKQLRMHNASETHEILEGVNIYGDCFSVKADRIATSFLSKMSINYAKMNTIEIIEAVDSVVVVNRNKSFFN